MHLRTLFAVVAVYGASTGVLAQTTSKCDPTKTSCPPDPAFGKEKFTCDFIKDVCNGFTQFGDTTIKHGNQGAEFTIQKSGQAPTIGTDQYIFFGRVDVEVQASPGNGIITSVVLISDDLDEIDWEWVGKESAKVQSNYFGNGDDGSYNRGGTHNVDNPAGSMHKYSIDWTPDAIQWIIDGHTVRTLNAADAGNRFPQSPMQVRLGIWAPTTAAGSAQGTIEWAGGPPDFSKAPFKAFYKNITIVDYAGGHRPTDKHVKEYVFGDQSGSAKSIQIKLKDGRGSESDLAEPKSITVPTSGTDAISDQNSAAGVTGNSTGGGFSPHVTNNTSLSNSTGPTTTSASVTHTPPVSVAASSNGMAIKRVIVGTMALALMV